MVLVKTEFNDMGDLMRVVGRKLALTRAVILMTKDIEKLTGVELKIDDITKDWPKDKMFVSGNDKWKIYGKKDEGIIDCCGFSVEFGEVINLQCISQTQNYQCIFGIAPDM